MVDVLSEAGADGLQVDALADAINRRQLYEKRDRSTVRPRQIWLRAMHYPKLFELDGPLVRLRSLGP